MSWKDGSSCFICGTRRFFLNHERMGMLLRQTNIHMVICDIEIPQQLTKSWWHCNYDKQAYPRASVTQTFRNGKPSHEGDRKTFGVVNVNLTTWELLFSSAPAIPATLYQNRNHNLLNTKSSERYILHHMCILLYELISFF